MYGTGTYRTVVFCIQKVPVPKYTRYGTLTTVETPNIAPFPNIVIFKRFFYKGYNFLHVWDGEKQETYKCTNFPNKIL